MAEKRAGGERETESVQGDKQKGQVGASRSSEGVPGAGRPAGDVLSRRPAGVRRGLAAPPEFPKAPSAPGLRCAGSGRRGGSGGEVRGSSAAGSGLTFLARGVLRSRSWRAPLTLRPGESHIAVPRRTSRAGQGRQDSSAAGLARVWRPALVPPLVPRTSQWHAVPSHAPGCLAPEVARAGTEGWRGPRAASEALPGATCWGRNPA